MDEMGLDELTEHVPEEMRSLYATIVTLTDAFCDEHLNDEYKQLCRELAVPLCQKGSPAVRGKPASWACGIVYTLGWVNFLSDPSTTPYMASADVAKGFGVSESTMHTKSKVIRQGLDLIPLDPDWCLPGRLADNPLVWMLEVNGMITDIRAAPREAQEAALRQGLIPFIPEKKEYAKIEGETDAPPEGIMGRIGF